MRTKFKYLVPLLLFFAPQVKADTLTLWTDNVQAGNTYGLKLCQYRCSINLIDQVGPFVDTGLPAEMEFSAAEVQPFLDYIMNFDPDPWTFVFTMGNNNIYAGHFASYPIAAATLTGMFISSTGDVVNYGVVGTNLVPEPSSLALLGVGLGLMAFFLLRPRRV